MNHNGPVSDPRSFTLRKIALLAAPIFIIASVAVVLISSKDDDPTAPTASAVNECLSPEDDCDVFQHPLELPAGLTNPYHSTEGGTEAVNGQIPPALAIDRHFNEFSLVFRYGEQSSEQTGHEFILPLNDDDREVINSEYGEMTTVIHMVSALNGVTQLAVFHGSISVNYDEGTDAARLQDEIETIIGHFG